MSAGLEASTVTPGRTPPDASRTVPAMVLVCADANSGARTRVSKTKQRTVSERIKGSSSTPRRRRGKDNTAASEAQVCIREASLALPHCPRRRGCYKFAGATRHQQKQGVKTL